MAKGLMKEGQHRIAEIEWLEKGHFNGKFYEEYPTFTTVKIVQETERAFYLKGQYYNRYGIPAWYGSMWVSKAAMRIKYEVSEQEFAAVDILQMSHADLIGVDNKTKAAMISIAYGVINKELEA